jgi:hypothetical protein
LGKIKCIQHFSYKPSEKRDYLGDQGVEGIIILKCWNYGYVPEEWNIVLPLFKRGDRENFYNYRGISL